jgi:ABC-type multidrug transport system ATPase subunit
MNGGNDLRRLILFRDLDFSIRSGQIIGLAGRTGSGKTTLGRIAAGILRPDTGTVKIDEFDVGSLSSRESMLIRRGLRYVPQNPDSVLPSFLRVRTAVAESKLVSGLLPLEQSLWSETIMDEDLFEQSWLERLASDLSLGQRRRVVNMLVLQNCPRFLVLDEPFNGLHSGSKEKLCQVIKEMASRKGSGILVISHEEEILSVLCHTVFVLADGMIKQWAV